MCTFRRQADSRLEKDLQFFSSIPLFVSALTFQWDAQNLVWTKKFAEKTVPVIKLSIRLNFFPTKKKLSQVPPIFFQIQGWSASRRKLKHCSKRESDEQRESNASLTKPFRSKKQLVYQTIFGNKWVKKDLCHQVRWTIEKYKTSWNNAARLVSINPHLTPILPKKVLNVKNKMADSVDVPNFF